MNESIVFQLPPAAGERLSQVCGELDAHLRQIETRLQVKIAQRHNAFRVTGPGARISRAESVIRNLFEMTARKTGPLTGNDVHLELARVSSGAAAGDGAGDGDANAGDANAAGDGDANATVDKNAESTVAAAATKSTESAAESAAPAPAEPAEIVVKLRKHLVRGQNPRQRDYLRRIAAHDINFAIGPAGTGKTYLAVACAVQALAEDRVGRMVLVRPAVEAGEKLGFLPGDIGEKIDPYLRPLFDALYEMLGFDRVGKLIARRTIELAPLAYMRGRTLNESFVILDEAQNATVEQMKMFLTRIGFGSRAIVTGDITQVDLPRGSLSGLKHAERVLGGIDGISFTRFLPEDVVRHPLVQRIVEAYDESPGGAAGES
ncbi:MAG: PhoH family protein [Gammaproteobacteria bacterium]|nr:PhoH family protein [Gammaproteobacteria bacterium]